jgi:hypothetical protein
MVKLQRGGLQKPSLFYQPPGVGNLKGNFSKGSRADLGSENN